MTIRSLLLHSALTGALFVSGVLTFLTPLPLLLLVARGDRRTALVLVAVAGLPLAAGYRFFFAGAEGAVAVGTLAALFGMGWCLGTGLRRGWEPTRCIGIAVGCVTLGVGAAVGCLAFVTDESVIGTFHSAVRQAVDEVLRLRVETMGANGPLAEPPVTADAITAAFVRLLPVVSWVTILYTAVLNAVIGRRILRVPGQAPTSADWARWKCPFGLVWICLASGIAFFLDRYIVRSGWLAVVAVEGIIAGGAVYFLQGVAVLQWAVRRAPVGWRWIVYIMLLLVAGTAVPLLALVGLGDVWIDFRQRLERQRGIPKG